MEYLNLFKLVNDALKQSNALPVALPVTLPVVDSEVGQPNLPEEDSPPSAFLKLESLSQRRRVEKVYFMITFW